MGRWHSYQINKSIITNGKQIPFWEWNSSFVLHEWFITLNCYPHGMIIQNWAIKESYSRATFHLPFNWQLNTKTISNKWQSSHVVGANVANFQLICWRHHHRLTYIFDSCSTLINSHSLVFDWKSRYKLI